MKVDLKVSVNNIMVKQNDKNWKFFSRESFRKLFFGCFGLDLDLKKL